jgi:transcriptional regulator with XRE-family HTH domain
VKVSIKSTANIGDIAKLARLSQGLDQLTAAGLCGVGQSFLSHVENGKDTAQIGKVLEVLLSLGVRIEMTLPPEVKDYLQLHYSSLNDLKVESTSVADYISQIAETQVKPFITGYQAAPAADKVFEALSEVRTKRVKR